MKSKTNRLFNDAVEKLNAANKELFRPKEDVVSYLVCKNAQHAVEFFLKGFLLQNGIDPDNHKTIESLYRQCKTINKNFEEINLSDFECKLHKLDSRYCNEISKVSNCFDVANSLDTFLKREKIIN